jgi:GH25 family lysozyme M1 (1,4-beta-N-acetylmuramidase)
MSTCRGIDVSAYQATQDWAAHQKTGVVFAFAKASEGQHTHDPKFATHITGIKQAGLVPGAYHFSHPNQDVALEAANYIAAVKPYAGTGFLHWLDLERLSDGSNYAGRTATQIRVWAATWLALVQEAFPGQRVGVYTSADDIAAGRVPSGATLWYPAYPGSAVDTYAEAEGRARPSPSGLSPLVWQFTSTPASGSRMDLNICYLSAASLRAWAAGTTEEDPMAGFTPQQIHDAVWKIDDIAAPPSAPDAKTNLTWQPQSYLKGIYGQLVAVQATEAAQTAAITALATAIGKVDAAIDVPGLVAEVKAAIDEAVGQVVIHLSSS